MLPQSTIHAAEDDEAAAPAVGSAEHAATPAIDSVGRADRMDCTEHAKADTPAVGTKECANRVGRQKFPRVDPPPVEDQPGQAIREDTPGYIAQAFPKLFPHGAGDFHCLRGGMSKLLKFEEWGRFVLLWHDGRFMRHPRFRYWLLTPFCER